MGVTSEPIARADVGEADGEERDGGYTEQQVEHGSILLE
jgi:hypothetical protein